MTSPDVFFIFSKFWFYGLLEGERGMGGQVGQKKDKKWPKLTKRFDSLCVSGTVPDMILVFGTHVSNDNISSKFFYFFKSLIFRVFQSSSINAKSKF